MAVSLSIIPCTLQTENSERWKKGIEEAYDPHK